MLREGYWKHWRRGFRIMHIVKKLEVRWMPNNKKEWILSAMSTMFWRGTRWTNAEECAASRQYAKHGTQWLQIHNSINQPLGASLNYIRLHSVRQLSLTNRKFEFLLFQGTKLLFFLLRIRSGSGTAYTAATNTEHKDQRKLFFKKASSIASTGSKG